MLLRFLPKGGHVAEIGVAEGEFSQQILEICKPAALHLIDPWEFQDRSDYLADGNNVNQKAQDWRFTNILKKFEGAVSTGQVHVHREYSQDAAMKLPDHYFDWIYVDAMHTYQAVLSDLTMFRSKIKPGGFILGHDYADNPNTRQMNFGVISAVNEFIRQSGWKFFLLTHEAYPTYVLSSPESELAEGVARSALYQCGGISFPNFPCGVSFTQVVLNDRNGQVKVFPEFRTDSE
jgi:hypothetical protein